MTDSSPPPDAPEPYRVLARKYRPQTFEALIGQDAMVRTLRNAIDAKRLAHAFIMTGVRGVGKTTTARLIARALNCVGPDGQGAETIAPCGVCDFCKSIAAGTHPDVIEMDAASNTGVDDVRSIIDNVPYAAASARYKIYIIDEVHMLSRNAFNALLKTLEEPPSHVKFIFATTEIRKVPITVLSRCQRFDLKRIDRSALEQHFCSVLEKEGVSAQPQAVSLIAEAAQGSVRDGLSLLDQAIAHAGGNVTADGVRSMLGLADTGAVLAIAEAALMGHADAALARFESYFKDGGDPAILAEELLRLVHMLTRLKLVPDEPADQTLPADMREALATLGGALSVSALSTAWQILTKALPEVRAAARPQHSMDMALVRLSYAASLPSPAELVKAWEADVPSGPGGASVSAQSGPAPSPGPTAPSSVAPKQSAPSVQPAGPSASMDYGAGSAQQSALATKPQHATHEADMPKPHLTLVASAEEVAPDAAPPQHAPVPDYEAFERLVQALENTKEGMLGYTLRAQMRLVEIQWDDALLCMRPTADGDKAIGATLAQKLQDVTGLNWRIQFVADGGGQTLQERANAAQAALREKALNHPAVQKALQLFQGAKVVDVRSIGKTDSPAPRPLDTAPDGYEVLPDEAYEGDYSDGAHPYDPDFDPDL